MYMKKNLICKIILVYSFFILSVGLCIIPIPYYDTKKDNSKITWHQQCYKGDNSTTLISEMSDWESFDDEGNFNKYIICLLMIS